MRLKLIAVIEDAMAKSTALIDAVPVNRSTYRAHAENITSICRDLLSQRPACDPSTPRICELGQVRYAGFPAQQSLLNRYAPLLRIWREAFQRMVRATASLPTNKDGGRGLDDADFAGLDAGTRGQIGIFIAVLRETKVENDRLKKLIRDSVPAPGRTPEIGVESRVDQTQVVMVREWLTALETGSLGLFVDDSGVRVNRTVAPRHVVMTLRVLAALKSLCSVGDKGSGADLLPTFSEPSKVT
jgi:hypothetical protein